jgi:putative transposase
VEHAREQYEVSERHACRLLGQWRRTQRYAANPKIDEEALTEAIIALANEYGRYGYRRITALLQRDGWRQRSGTAHLASRGAEGAAETPAPQAVVAE